MNVYGEYPDEVYFINEHEELTSQRVLYDWKPIFCEKCKELGHTEGKCRTGEQRQRVSMPTPRLPKEGEIAATDRGAPKAATTSDHVSTAQLDLKDDKSKPLKPYSQLHIQQPHAKPPPQLLSTPRNTIEIYSTNAFGEVAITTIEALVLLLYGCNYVVACGVNPSRHYPR
ncbi:unnamed protein product [Amaranthus hypochondriacus]